jgi:peptidoglycan/xylan/chitin deacetylase (PgdA/CDA1 family)
VAEFRWRWKGVSPAPEVRVAPFLYGKSWAYSVEIDDGPASTLAVSLPLLASYYFTDAPPGVSGGKLLPFVGGAAVFPLRVGTGSPAYLETAQLPQLERAGWAVLNHGYAHRGNSWEPDGALTPAQLREELFWSQVVLAAERTSRRSPTHFVYPNGYMAYQSHLSAFGLTSGSRVGGKKPGLDTLSDLDRNYLDESVWSKANDPLMGLPRAPQPGQWVIDFTHGMEAAPTSPNHKRWRERLGFIERLGDALWCAPTPAVAAYLQAARAAKLKVERDGLTLTLPENLPGSPLTLQLKGLPADAATPPGATLYRQGDTAWLTTPQIGKPDVAPPAALERLYTGPVRELHFPGPVRVAGVRLLQRGETRPDFRLSLALTTSGHPQILADTPLKPAWGVWLLYPLLPNAKATTATGIVPTTDPALTTMEVWVQP